MFSGANLLTSCHSASCLFSDVFGSRKASKEIFSELDGTKAKVNILPRRTRSPEGQAECHYAMFSLCETNKHLAKHCYSWIFCLRLFMLHHSFFVLLLELCLSCYDWSTMIPAINVLQILWSSLWWCMSPQKLFFLFITYLLEDEQELSLRMLIHCKCIYNFWCSMLGFIYFLVCCSNFGVLSIHFVGLTY